MSAQVFSQINMPKAVKTAVLYTVLLHLPSQFIRSGKRFDSDPRVWSPNHYCTRNLLYVLPWPVSHFSLHDVDLQSNNAINVNNRYFFFMSSCDTQNTNTHQKHYSAASTAVFSHVGHDDAGSISPKLSNHRVTVQSAWVHVLVWTEWTEL